MRGARAHERVCAFEGCGVRFTPAQPNQLYHSKVCRKAHQEAERRRRAREQATLNPNERCEVASAYMEPTTPSLLAVMCDVEREALAQKQSTRVVLLESTLAGVAAAHEAGDRSALRGELVALAAQAAEWAARLPRPTRRRAPATSEAAAAGF